ncbi:hypothetical protein ACOMHN_046848 [Nucella lapillus]
MEIEEASNVTVSDHVVATRVTLGSGAILKKFACKGGKSKKKKKGETTQGTQTEGHVFAGKQGEVIITTNYAVVELVLDNGAVQRLADSACDVDHVTDTVLGSLARLDWNGERILEKTMTSVHLTLTRDIMPQLITEIADMLKTEHEHHTVQRLAQHLLEKRMARLFGIDVGSLIFIIEFCSVDDALSTLTSKKKQEELQGIFFNFLPDWATPCATLSVAPYRLTPGDRAEYFGFEDPVTLSFLCNTWSRPERPSVVSARGDVYPISKTGRYLQKEGGSFSPPSAKSHHAGGKQSPGGKESSQYKTTEKPRVAAWGKAMASTSGVSVLESKPGSGVRSIEVAEVSEGAAAAAVSQDQPVSTASSLSSFAGSYQAKGDDDASEGRGPSSGGQTMPQSVQSPRTAAALGGRRAVVQDAKFHDMFIHIILEPRGWAEAVQREREEVRRDCGFMVRKRKTACVVM